MTQPRSGGLFLPALALCGAGIGSYAVAAIAVPPGADIPRHVAWFLVAFAFYLGAIVLLLREEHHVPKTSSHLCHLLLVFGVAVLLRLVLLATTPSLSDDIFRYVWDGRVINSGLSPYAYPPDAPELSALRNSLWEGINHKGMVTPYPPLAELLFALTYRLVPDSLRAMQALAVLFDLGVAAALVALLGRMGMDRRRVLIYAWNPLVLVQFAHSGHFDAAMVLPLLVAVYMLSAGRRLLSGAMLGLSASIKVVPLMLGPLFLPLWGIGGILSAGVVTAAGLIPWLAASGVAGVASEASDARFNDSLGLLLVRGMAMISPDPEAAARGLGAAMLVVASLTAALLIWKRATGWIGLMGSVYLLIGLFLLLNAVVEPWYFTWILPFLCFKLGVSRRGLPWLDPSLGWLLATGLVILTDLSYVPGVASSAWVWIRLLEYGPLFLLLVLWPLRRLGAQLLPDPGAGVEPRKAE